MELTELVARKCLYIAPDNDALPVTEAVKKACGTKKWNSRSE